MGIAQKLAEFSARTTTDAVGSPQKERACDAICDTIGVGAAGSDTDTVTKLLTSVPALAVPGSGEPGTGIIGRRSAIGPELAALVNGTAMHALDFDDIAHPAYAHPTAVILPTFLAMCREGEIDGDRALTAYVVALEAINRLGHYVNLDHYREGWHATSTLGTLAAALGAAHLVELPQKQTVAALSIAASMAGGLRANFGTMTKPLHAGLAARGAVEAVLLAKQGFTASDDGLSAQNGFFDAFSNVTVDPDEFARGLGEPWEIDAPVGLALKPYPSCGGTHSSIEAALLLRERVTELPAHVTVGVNELMPALLVHDRPRTGLEAKFSMPYCIAISFLTGKPVLSDFHDDAAVQRIVESDFFDNIEMVVDERIRTEAEPAGIVEVVMPDGRRDAETVMISKGKGARWMSLDEQREKFFSCLDDCPELDGETLWTAGRSLLTGGTLNALESSLTAMPVHR